MYTPPTPFPPPKNPTSSPSAPTAPAATPGRKSSSPSNTKLPSTITAASTFPPTLGPPKSTSRHHSETAFNAGCSRRKEMRW
ncbi:hypothetical protein EAE96_004329 [Botrytis aclada]|nr:hypothetical protein EAE96_004329 [Botrytis aclada]